jgi:hypothetical protein
VIVHFTEWIPQTTLPFHQLNNLNLHLIIRARKRAHLSWGAHCRKVSTFEIDCQECLHKGGSRPIASPTKAGRPKKFNVALKESPAFQVANDPRLFVRADEENNRDGGCGAAEVVITALRRRQNDFSRGRSGD